jgi:hypothetical protein
LSADRRNRFEQEYRRVLCALQNRGEPTLSALPKDASSLYEQLHAILARARLADMILTPPYQLSKLVQLSPPDFDPKTKRTVHSLVGGPKDLDRLLDAADPTTRIVRDDGTVIHFSLTIADGSAGLELIAYNFEAYRPLKQRHSEDNPQEPFAFIRFDLAFRGRKNEERGMRSHLHPGTDDIQVPSAWLSPAEALTYLVVGCRVTGDDC